MSKILNFGSINIDYVYGVHHFSRPGETIASKGLERFAGGKGLNQSVALARAGAQVWHAGCINKSALDLVELMKASGVHTELVNTGGLESGHAIIEVDEQGENRILLHHGANYEISESYVQEVLPLFGEGDMLLLQNEINKTGYIMEEAHRLGMQIAFNPSPFDESIFELPLENVDWFLVNEIEAQQLTGATDIGDSIQALKTSFPTAGLVVTLGQNGVICWHGSNEYHNEAYKVSVVDSTGAGDTFTGFFLALILEGYSIKRALDLASRASSISVSRSGAAPSIPKLEEVLSSESIQS